MNTLVENIAVVAGLPPDVDRYNLSPTSDYVSMANGRELTFFVIEGTGTTGRATLTINAASTNTGTGAEAIAYEYRTQNLDGSSISDWIAALAAGFQTAAGGDQIITIRVMAERLPEGKPFVSLTATESVDAPVDAAVLMILSNLRYPQEKPTAPTS